jgi:hypothetical protein
MAISIDHHDITQALREYKLEVTDYYLEFTDQCIYMYWVACPSDIEEYLAKGDWACLDFQIKGTWKSAEELFAEPFTERPFTNCRYILATN